MRFLLHSQLVIVATDTGTPPLNASITLTVQVNRNGPVFTQTSFGATIDEGVAVGSVVITATATNNGQVIQ